MTRDRREELGLDREGLMSHRCPSCGTLVDVRTERDAYATRQYFCSDCGTALGAEAKGSFEAPELDWPDA
jgi:predicted RNA-binding Zn-ribbon protein involved in translation (DUF1610 family)